MRASHFSKSQRFIVAFLLVLFAVISFAAYDYRKLPDESVRKFNRQNEPYDIGPLKINGKMPNGPGDHTLAPYLEIPESRKFYVSIAEPDIWCVNEDCGIDGAFIQTLGGWLQVDDTDQQEVKATFGLDLLENKNIRSIVFVGDNRGKIVGIYPNKKLSDALDILKNYPILADFNILDGVSEFGSLKVGEFAPLKPGDPISHLSDELEKNSKKNVPTGKNFYIYGLEKRKYDMVGMYEKYENKYLCFFDSCRYPEPDPPHDFLYADIYELNGWFLANDINGRELIKLFGMEPEEVLSGKASLVVVTDASGVILALHPGKTLSDTLTILSLLPSNFYRQFSATSDDALLLKNFLGWE